MAALTPNAAHPMRQLLALLPRLAQTPSHQPDFEASDPALLVQIAEACELLQRVTSLGISAIGQLLAHAAAEVDSGEFGQDAIEALGWVLSDMADAAAACLQLAAPCRRAAADFTGARHE